MLLMMISDKAQGQGGTDKLFLIQDTHFKDSYGRTNKKHPLEC